MDTIEKRIRDRAYHLWEQEGRPHGRQQEHWQQARSLLGLDSGHPAPSVPEPVEPIGAVEPQVNDLAGPSQKPAGPVRRSGLGGAVKRDASAAPKPKGGRSSGKEKRP